MNFKPIDFSSLKQIAKDNNCARSSRVGGQASEMVLYTRDFENQFNLYEKILGALNLRFKGDDIACFYVGKSEFLLQGVSSNSPFVKLCGNQCSTFTLQSVDALKSSQLIKPSKQQEDMVKQLSWDTPVLFAEDLEGNLILLVETQKGIRTSQKSDE